MKLFISFLPDETEKAMQLVEVAKRLFPSHRYWKPKTKDGFIQIHMNTTKR